ncbi:enoyl-CoA hydratase/isomerase family protein [Lysinibacillus sp. LZ02]|uniref:enoyl-CoA hydratase/isomerase family protein n=1 Tax=Lysinibacillus sp. LZ02 TaxID=3420668 RepID=UPI003D35EB1F
MLTLDYIHLSIVEQIGYITLNRPEVLNALDEKMVNELQEAFTYLEKQPTIRLIIVQGAGGKAFAAGADIKALEKRTPLDGLTLGMQHVYTQIEQSAKVTIAVINGFALGGGCELALACDIRIATEKAKFGLPELNLGVLPGAGGTQRLTRIIGKGRALDLILTGRIVSGEEAQQMGLATYYCTETKLEQKMHEITEAILKKSPIAVQLTKQAVHHGFDVDMQTAQWIEKLSISLLFGTEDKAEGTRAFIEKRPANFTNQ